MKKCLEMYDENNMEHNRTKYITAIVAHVNDIHLDNHGVYEQKLLSMADKDNNLDDEIKFTIKKIGYKYNLDYQQICFLYTKVANVLDKLNQSPIAVTCAILYIHFQIEMYTLANDNRISFNTIQKTVKNLYRL